jgi:hypothetical protein
MINILATTTCVLAMTNHWLVAHVKLKAVYILGIVNGLLFVLLNALIAAEGSAQIGVALLVIPSGWMVFTSGLGLWRLHRFERSLTDRQTTTGQSFSQPSTQVEHGPATACSGAPEEN